MAYIQMKHSYKRYKTGDLEIIANNDVSFDIEKGELVVILGASGAGKSTVLNILGGMDTNDEGRVIIDGKDITRLPEHKRAAYIGRVFQDPMMGTAATMQIDENLALAARRGAGRTLRIGITKKENAEYHELLKTLGLGLEDRLKSPVGLLSGGQRQRITLAVAAMLNKPLIIIDEPTSALDAGATDKVLSFFRRQAERGAAVLAVSHDKDFAAGCHYVIEL